MTDETPVDLEALERLWSALLEAVPPELRARLLAALRELLEALRALIEWLLGRLERPGPDGEPPTVREIPVL